ncbi:T9SS type A sorting domain-containing protein [Christiangramia forsetii]|uniref:Protein containing immunoglobulin-like domain n=2 Tax=Christiangramia forsetii TaxID=411153 RepID=A0LYD4_CHRFK|nr:T9SS type A sorting domain-containing protein [Christiangramia forsetii]GGG34505.1 hypothetical protein GCM10011532_17700 [Christiangramia forsetii]CAL65379.1 protein containing immunoglobulin-like domain [Christiangramia forsetii KT0803]
MGEKLHGLFFLLILFLPVYIWGQCPASVSISADTGNTICEGTTVTYTVTPNGGAGAFTYQWKIDGANQGAPTTTNTFSRSNLTNGQVVSVEVTDANGSTCSVSNNGSPITVNPTRTPTVNFNVPAGTLCTGNIKLTATNTNAGSSPTYQWYVDGNLEQNSSSKDFTFNYSTAKSFSVRVVLNSSYICPSTPTVEVTKTVTTTSNPTISTTDPNLNGACINQPITPIIYNIGGSGTGATVNGLPPGVTGSFNSGTFTISGSPTASGVFNYTVNTQGPCTNVSEGGTIEVLKDATISLTSGSTNQTVCQSENIENIVYAIGETGNDASVSNLPTGLSGSFSAGNFTISGSSAQTGTFNYTIFATGTCGNSSTLNGTIIINANLTPSVSITSSEADNIICEGTQVTFTANPINGGSNPSYQWKIGNTNSGTNSNTFITTALALGDQDISVILTSNETCLTEQTATSNIITTTVNENLTPAVNISASDSDICQGDEITFTATPTNGGSSPLFQWKIGSTNVGSNSNQFSTSALTNGQEVSVIMTSNETCLASVSATSNIVTAIVNPNLTPSVSIASNDSDNIICSGGAIQFTATPTNGGNSPTYEWFINGSSIGNNSATYSTSSLTNGQTVKVRLTSNEDCLDINTAESNEITVQVDGSLSGILPSFDNSDPTHNSSAICPVTELIYKINPIPGARSYNWTYPAGWTVVSQNINLITLKAGVNAQSGNISVTAVNDCGNSNTLTESVSTGTVVLVNAGPDQSVCIGTNQINLAGEIGGVITKTKDWSWSASVSGGSFSNGGNNLTGTYIIPNTIKNNGGTVTITITSIDPSGPCDAKTDSMVLTVLKNATISNPANKNQTVCINQPIANIDFNITDAGTGATASGLPPGINGNFNSGVFTVSGSPTQSGTYDYTVNTTGSCTSQQISQTGTITVNPNNTIADAANKDQTVCINQLLQGIQFPVNSTVTSVNTSGLPTGITGNISNGNFILTGTPTASGTFAYSLNTAGTCESASTSGVITVTPDVTISDPVNKNQTVCINTAIDNIQFDISSPGTEATVSGLPDGLSGTFSNGIFTISGVPTEASAVAGDNGIFNYSVQTEGECVQVTANGTITIIPDPTATISYPENICTSIPGSINATLDGTGDYNGGLYSSTPAGLTISASSGAITPASSQPGTYTVSYKGPDTCNPATASVEITINPEPFVEITYGDPFCNSDSTLKEPVFNNGVGNYENGVFSSSEPGGLSIDSSTGQINAQTSSPGTYDVFYTIGEDSGCSEILITTEVTITQIPQIIISYPETICSSETSVAVSILGEDGNYQNGVYSGTNGLSIAADGTINPSASNAGPHSATYTIPTEAGCEQVIATADFIIKEVPLITTNPVNTGVCSNSPAEFEVIATGDDLNFQWYRILENGTEEMIAGENAAKLSFTNVTSADALGYYVTVSGDDSCGEDTSEIVTLNVDEDIIITEPSEDITICEDTQDEISFLFIGHANGAILDFNWYKDGNLVTAQNGKIAISVTGPDGPNGEYTGELTITDPQSGENGDSGVYYVVVDGPDYFTCPEATSKTFTFRVEPRPEAPSVTDRQYCLEDNAGSLTATGEEGNDIKWYTLNAGEYTFIGNDIPINTSTPTTFEYYATQTRPNGCESNFSEVLTIEILNTPPPVSTETIVFEYCHNEEGLESLIVTPADGAEINWYNSIDAESPMGSAPTPATDVVGTTTYYVSQTFATTTGCESDISPVEVTIKAIPNVVVDIVGDENTICLGSSVDFTATGATSYTWYLGETVLQTGETASYQASPTVLGENIYTVVGTTNGCTNTYNISVFVDDNSIAGGLDAPERICVSNGSATVSLQSKIGNIIKWEYSNASTADVWTETAETDLNDSRTFNGLTETTSYRVTVKNGVCEDATSEATVIVDQLPEGGKALWTTNNDRLFLSCENPASGYASSITLSGYSGQIVSWEYRGVSDNAWTTINNTTSTLTRDEVENAVSNESTAFRAKIVNGSCDTGNYSETAIISVIEADIKPTPVEVNKDVICIGDQITLSSETGYSADGGKFDGGAFDNAGIKNHGWDFTNPDGSKNDFDSAANNGRADHWLRMNPHGSNPANEKVYTANLYPIANQGPTNGSMVNFRTFSTNAGNKGFALVTGNNDSYMETPVFSLGGLDEAILTWDQAYNLTEGARIRVEISTNGGSTYETVVFDTIGTATSGNYNNFGDLTPAQRPLNKMVVDLGAYLGQSNLRIRFNYEGTIDGDVWAVDNIEVPEGPQDIILQWYYDDDLTDPDSYLEPIGEVNQYTVNFIPRKIGWNDFEVQTRIILDSNGNECQSIDNFETIRVWAFDRYTTNVETVVGSCGSLTVKLDATVTAEYQAKTITEYPTLDGYVGSWKVEDSAGNEVTAGFTIINQDSESSLDPLENPSAIFTADNLGDYNFKWILTPTAVDESDNLLVNSECPPVENTNNVTLVDCTTLDFDGDNDYIDLGNNYNGNFFVEAWIRPFDRALDDGSGNTNASTGVIFSTAGLEIRMENLPSGIVKNTRWYHIAVANNGDIWVDGVPSGNIDISASGINNTSIGARFNANTKTASNHFSGWIDELRIWNNNNKPDLKEIRFMMNQRIKLNDAASATSLVEGEVVPNLIIPDGISSYHTSGAHNLDQDGDTFYNQTWGDLEGYYRLISENPDPAGLISFADNLKPNGGFTPDHSITKVPGRLVNITTDQENTSPTPYLSGSDGSWANINTWARPAVWDYPNSTYNNIQIDWNIARINHNITADSKEIVMLGILSETPGQLLTVNGDVPIRITHYLLLDGNMDLAGESQLLQDHGSILANASQGWAEIDQQGRKISYNYNYWTSPHSNQGSDNNSGFLLNQVLMDGTNPATPKTIIFKDGYFSADGVKTNPITISNEWIWDFRGGRNDDYSDWLHLGSDFTEIVGAGYSMKGTDGTAGVNDEQNYVFRGKPNNGNIPTGDLNIVSGRDFLVGNPYPSAIDGLKFIDDNAGIFNGSLYFWDHFAGRTHILKEYVGGYATWNRSGGLKAISNDWRINEEGGNGSLEPGRYIPVAQGFFISTFNGGSGGNINFNNTQRVYVTESEAPSGGDNPSVFLQYEDNTIKAKVTDHKSETSEDTRLKIRLKFESPKKYHRQILVTMDENTTNGFDLGYDAPLIENNLEDMYWYFEERPYVIQGVPNFEKDQVLPLAIKSKEGGEFIIKIDKTENWPSGKELYLKDNLLDTIHNIIKEPYKSKTDESGEIKDRFEIVFFKEQAQDPAIPNPDPDDIVDPGDLPNIDGLVGISYSTFRKQVKISNFDMLDVSKVMIFDMAGKLIQQYDEIQTEREILLGMRPVRSGVYIIKVFSEKGISDKKVIIK